MSKRSRVIKSRVKRSRVIKSRVKRSNIRKSKKKNKGGWGSAPVNKELTV